ncbi:MAG: hypothetical protein WBQ25_16640 [Nitrososphaeraceae archaeon]
MTTVVYGSSNFSPDIGAITKGLEFVLRHFNQANLFPRNISTKATEGKQLAVFNKQEALARFKQANGLDCRIAAYHNTNWRKGLSKLIAPDFLFMDLDLGTLGTVERLELALTNTLSKIKQKMDGVPSVIWSGNGYHIYQPVEAFILEEQQIFNGLDQPSRRLVQYAERYLTSGKMDACHNLTMSLKNCMLRVPGSLNSKSNPPKPVKVIQTWDGNRPDIKPLLQGCYIYLQALRLKKLQKEQREAEYFSKYHSHLYDKTRSGFCKYWRRGKGH